MKKGISLVALVITIVVLVILTATILNTTKWNNNDTQVINQYGKKAIIEDINIKIKKAKLKNEIQGISKITMEEIIPIIQEHGTFNNNILKLTTTRGIEIWLYEIIPIPLEEYATITYENNILTVQTELINNGYRIQYTTDAGNSWSLYNNPVTVSEESGIQIRLINEQGQVVSNIFKITGADSEKPMIEILPNGIELAKDVDVTITVTDSSGLATNNIYEYYLSTSNTTQIGGEWITYTNATTFKIGTGLTGTYYLHVKEVYDKAGNVSENVVSQSYTFDNTIPYSFTPTIGTVTENSIQINANTSDNNGQAVTYYYSIDNGATWLPSGGTSATTYTFTNLTEGTTYNGIKVKAVDTVGNERISENLSISTISMNWNGKCDIDWYIRNTNATTFNIYGANELAGLALLVNNPTVYYDNPQDANATSGTYNVKGTNFSGKTIVLNSDLVLNTTYSSYSSWTYSSKPSYTWEAIGKNTIKAIPETINSSNFNSIVNKYAGDKKTIYYLNGSTYTSTTTYNSSYTQYYYYPNFSGTFNGGGHKINGMYQAFSDVTSSGLFGNNYGTVQNIIVQNSKIITGADCGLIVGRNYGNIYNCGSLGALERYSYTTQAAGTYGWNSAGIAGRNTGTIANCYNKATLVGNKHNAGISGTNSGNIYNCYNAGSVTTYQASGGITSRNNSGSVISYCYNSGALSASGGYANTIYGYTNSGTITNSYAFTLSGTTGTIATAVSPNGTSTTNLLTALNGWVSANSSVPYSTWKADTNNINGGYPIFTWQ